METSGSSRVHRFRLDRDGYQLLEENTPVRLERQPMELLILLVERKGQLVTREDIATLLWGDDVFVDTDRNINSIVRKLRQALKDDPDHPEFVETVVGKGYRFVGPLELSPKKPDAPSSVPGQRTVGTDSRLVLKPLLAITLLVMVALATWTVRRFRSPASESIGVRSIAVLPLDNVSGDPAQEYFTDGMTQELTTELAQTAEVRVISHTSVLQYKGTRKSVAQIASELHVDALIEGSVLRTGDRVRVTAQLIRAPSGHSIWANSYERGLRDVLNLQRDITQDIAEQVKIKLIQSRLAASGARRVDPGAHDAYLNGLFHFEKNTEKDLEESISDFQQALAADPNYGSAYAAMADAYMELGVLYWPPPQAMPQAKAAALKALELDPNLSAAHESLGSVYYFYEWDWAAAEREAKKAIALNPSNAYAHDLLAAYYGTVGRFGDSLQELEQARDLAPRSGEILGDTVFWVFMSRNYDLAIANGEAVIEAEPDNAFAQVFLGMAYVNKGRPAEGLLHANLASHYDGSPLIASFRANVYALAGHKKEAATALREIEKRRIEHYSCAYEVGTAYVLLGQTDLGFRWLENAYEGHSECMILLKVDPRLDSVRSDPRYQSLLRRTGLAD